jgi:hypothetical protein
MTSMGTLCNKGSIEGTQRRGIRPGSASYFRNTWNSLPHSEHLFSKILTVWTPSDFPTHATMLVQDSLHRTFSLPHSWTLRLSRYVSHNHGLTSFCWMMSFPLPIWVSIRVSVEVQWWIKLSFVFIYASFWPTGRCLVRWVCKESENSHWRWPMWDHWQNTI